MAEKFTIEITENGMELINDSGVRFYFTAVEAVMLLDILKNEEHKLKKMAEDASPIPIKIKF